MFKKIVFLVLTVFITSCSTTHIKLNKKPLTLSELEYYVSIRNSQQVVEHGFSNKKNYASNYRFLTQQYIELLILELRQSKVKMDLNGKILLNIELYKIELPAINKSKQRNGIATLKLRMIFSDGETVEITETKNLVNNDMNVNMVIHYLIVTAAKRTIHNNKFFEYIKKYI